MIILLPGTAKRYGSQAMITSGPVLRPPQPLSPSPHPNTRHDHQYQHKRTGKHTHTHRCTIARTCWPVLLRRREMLSNSAFQHSTSDYLFSFTGRFELVMYFPFSAFLPFSLALMLTGNSLFPGARDPLRHNLRGQAFFHMSR